MKRSSILDRLRRDFVTLQRRVVGSGSPVFTSYSRPTEAGAVATRRMRVTNVTRLTPDAVSLRLAPIFGAPIAFVPGQFVTLLVSIDGRVLRRSYSICSPASDRTAISIGVKRVPGGAVSTYLCDRVSVGETMDVLGPSGAFTVDLDPTSSRTFVLIAGGSGITPIFSIIRSVLDVEPAACIALVFSNRSRDQIMFAAELAELASSHPTRLVICHVLEEPPQDWDGHRGQLTGDLLATVVEGLPFTTRDACWYICGPTPMMEIVRRELLARDVPPAQIRQERFASPSQSAPPAGDADTMHSVRARAQAKDYRFSASSRSTVLSAGLAAGVPLAYSCMVGGCGSCRVRLVAGEVDMEEPNCLLDGERESGYVLACVARPRTSLQIEVEPGGDS